MQLGMIGLGRMGANMVRRLIKGGHECVVFDMSPKAVAELVTEKAVGSASLAEFVKKLAKPRAVWLMVPAGVVDKSIADLLPHLESGDILIDGGNSYYIDDIRRAKELKPKGIHYMDVGTSGGVWGLERGYCMMVGGETDAVKRLEPIGQEEHLLFGALNYDFGPDWEFNLGYGAALNNRGDQHIVKMILGRRVGKTPN